jgi:hypothetical protein
MEELNYLNEKKEILELKLSLTSILLEKKESIRCQQYENAAVLREREKQLLKEFQIKIQALSDLQKNLIEHKNLSEELYHLNLLIEEIKLQLAPFKYHNEQVEDYYANIEKDFSHIVKLRNEINEDHRMKEDNEKSLV